jgi:hypothetical protein
MTVVKNGGQWESDNENESSEYSDPSCQAAGDQERFLSPTECQKHGTMYREALG